jgi:hypothetical protein
MNQSLVADFHDVLTAVETTGLFVSVCNISAPTQALDGAGQVDLTDYSPVAGLQGIKCMRAPLADVKPNPYYEAKTEQQINEMNIYHVLLDGNYPTIVQGMRATIDGEPLDILNAESDSQGITTRLAIRRYEL